MLLIAIQRLASFPSLLNGFTVLGDEAAPGTWNNVGRRGVYRCIKPSTHENGRHPVRTPSLAKQYDTLATERPRRLFLSVASLSLVTAECAVPAPTCETAVLGTHLARYIRTIYDAFEKAARRNKVPPEEPTKSLSVPTQSSLASKPREQLVPSPTWCRT